MTDEKKAEDKPKKSFVWWSISIALIVGALVAVSYFWDKIVVFFSDSIVWIVFGVILLFAAVLYLTPKRGIYTYDVRVVRELVQNHFIQQEGKPDGIIPLNDIEVESTPSGAYAHFTHEHLGVWSIKTDIACKKIISATILSKAEWKNKPKEDVFLNAPEWQKILAQKYAQEQLDKVSE